METDFNLMQTLNEWRSRLGPLSEDDRVEIEDHLQDSMRELRESGLTEREAFLIARDRLGEIQTSAVELPARRLVGRWWWTAAGILGLASAVVCLVVSLFVPKLHEGRCVVELLCAKDELPNQRAIFESEETLVEVMHSQGHALDATAAARDLRTRVHFDPIPETAMVVIRVEDPNATKAAELADAIPAAYQSRRLAMAARDRDYKLLALDGAVAEARERLKKLTSTDSEISVKSPSLGVSLEELDRADHIHALEDKLATATEDWEKSAATRALAEARSTPARQAPKPGEIALARQSLTEAMDRFAKFQALPATQEAALRIHEQAAPNLAVLPSPAAERTRWWALGLALVGAACLTAGGVLHKATGSR